MLLAFSTNAFTRFSLDRAMREIASAGFAGVEILADVPHAYPDAIDGPLIDLVQRVRAETGLRISNVNVNCTFGYWRHAPAEPYFEPSLISPDAQHRKDRIRLIGNAIRFAREVGASCVSITSGRCLGGMPPARASGQFAESIKPILELAESLEIDVGIECEPGLYIEWAAELREWIDRLGSARFGANLDIGHSVVMGENVREVLRLLKGRIWNLHVEDLPGRKHYHTVPGEGTFDWIDLREGLREIGYDRFATVELYTETAEPKSAADRSYAFLSRLF